MNDLIKQPDMIANFNACFKVITHAQIQVLRPLSTTYQNLQVSSIYIYIVRVYYPNAF